MPASPQRRLAELAQLRRSIAMDPNHQVALTKGGVLALIDELSHLYELQQKPPARQR